MAEVKVLVVEDDSMMAFLHKELIKKKGIAESPICFKNGKEALNFILADTRKKSKYMILLDLNMPVMNGWTFLEELEKAEVSSQAKVAIVTSSIDSADRKKAEEFEAVEFYLTKPLLDFSPIERSIAQLRNLGPPV